jgi:hypothetical protein
VLFLFAKGLNAKDIYKEMFPDHGGKCLSFNSEILSSADDALPGRPAEIATEETAQGVEQLIRADRRITTDSVTTALGCSHGLAYSMMHDPSKFRNVWAW